MNSRLSTIDLECCTTKRGKISISRFIHYRISSLSFKNKSFELTVIPDI